jgi:phage FluMu protein Com
MTAYCKFCRSLWSLGKKEILPSVCPYCKEENYVVSPQDDFGYRIKPLF